MRSWHALHGLSISSKRAFAEYDLAARFDPEYGELYYWRARVFVDRNDLGRALADLETAVRFDPAHFDSYLLLDWSLARERRWDDIAYWSRFIELQPENARAYLERGGAYYHKGDLRRRSGTPRKPVNWEARRDAGSTRSS